MRIISWTSRTGAALCALMCFMCALMCFISVATAAVYKWTDAKGQVQFSDHPPPEQRNNAKVLGVQVLLGR